MTKERKCGRDDCGEPEFRIDGYCSDYCRDIDELEAECKEREQDWKALAGRLAEVVPQLIEIWRAALNDKPHVATHPIAAAESALADYKKLAGKEG